MVELTDEEFQAVAQAIRHLATVEREDVMGAFMKTGGGHVLPGMAIVTLSRRIEECPEIIPVPMKTRIQRILDQEEGRRSKHAVAGIICHEYEKAAQTPEPEHFDDPELFKEVQGWIRVRQAALDSGHR